MSPREELSQRVLKAMVEGISVSTADALQLRSWANNTSDAVGTLELKRLPRISWSWKITRTEVARSECMRAAEIGMTQVYRTVA
jgi:hypothetical protein